MLGSNGYSKGMAILNHTNNYTQGIRNEFYESAYKIWRSKEIKYFPSNLNVIKNDWIYYNILLTDDDGRVFKPPGYYTEESLPSCIPKYLRDLPVQIPIRDLRVIC